MGTKIKKRVCILSATLILSLNLSVVPALGADNNIVDIQFTENENEITAVIYTEKGYNTPIKPVKAGDYYNIILPNIGKGSKSSYSPNISNIDLVRVTTLPSTTNNGSYTKIAIKAKPGIAITAFSQIYDENTNELRENPRHTAAEQSQAPEYQTEEDTPLEEEEIAEEVEEVEEIAEEEEKPDENVPSSLAQPLSDNNIVPQTTTSSTQNFPATSSHTSEILYILIGSMAVLLVIVLLYIKGKDKMQELCGDMNISFDDDKKKKIPQKKESKKVKKEIRQPGVIDLDYSYNTTPNTQATQVKPITTTEKVNESEQVVIDLDEIYSGSTSQSELPNPTNGKSNIPKQAQENEEDIDDFLASFVDEDNEGSAGDEIIEINQQTKDDNQDNQAESNNLDIIANPEEENPINNLIDDLLKTQNMSFTTSDINKLQTTLQADDLSPELLNQAHFSSKQTPEFPLLTLEDFDKQYPLLSDKEIEKIINNPNIKFNDIDINVIFSPITSYEISEDAVLEAQLRKEKENEANIQYYENEKDFAFTLIKTQDVQNPDNLVIWDNNVYPDLANVDFSNDAIFKEFSFAKPDILDTKINEDAPSEEDIDNAIAREMELINKEAQEESRTENNTEKQDDSILSEFTLIQPDVETVKSDDQFSTTIFTSMDDIEAQFKSLGVEFNSDNNQEDQTIQNSTEEPQNEINTDTEVIPSVQTSIKTELENETNIITHDNTEIYASCQIDFSTELYIASYNNKISLIGTKNGSIKHLHDFDDGKVPSKLSARKADEMENGEIRYLVRADKEKFVIDVSNDDIKLVLIL